MIIGRKRAKLDLFGAWPFSFENDKRPVSNREFGKQIGGQGFQPVKSHNTRYYKGLSLIGGQGGQGGQQNMIDGTMENSQHEIYTNLPVPAVPAVPDNSQTYDYLDIFKKTDNVPPVPRHADTGPSLEREREQIPSDLVDFYDDAPNSVKSQSELEGKYSKAEIEIFIKNGWLDRLNDDYIALIW